MKELGSGTVGLNARNEALEVRVVGSLKLAGTSINESMNVPVGV
jgi:hypothetical protein